MIQAKVGRAILPAACFQAGAATALSAAGSSTGNARRACSLGV